MMLPLDLNLAGAWILGSAALVSALVALVKGVKELRKFWKELRQTLDKFFGASTKFDQLSAQVKEIHKEVKTNGGGSMKDQLNRIETDLTLVRARQDANTNLADDILWEADAQGAVTAVNRRFLELVGRSREEVLGMNWKNTIHPDDVVETSSRWLQAVADQRDSEFYYRIVRSDGAIIPVKARGVLKRDGRGQMIGWFGNVVLNVEDATRNQGIIPPPAKRKKRILFVEDGADFRELGQIILSHDYEVEAHATGAIAIQEFQAAQTIGKPFDLIILDYSMADMDGAEVSRAIRGIEKLRYATPIVFCTGVHDQQIDASVLGECRIRDVWKKPISTPELRSKVAEVMAS